VFFGVRVAKARIIAQVAGATPAADNPDANDEGAPSSP